VLGPIVPGGSGSLHAEMMTAATTAIVKRKERTTKIDTFIFMVGHD